MGKSARESPAQKISGHLEPWQNWGDTVRYLAIRIGYLIATVIVVLLAYRLLGVML
jgi:hypothetical protein